MVRKQPLKGIGFILRHVSLIGVKSISLKVIMFSVTPFTKLLLTVPLLRRA